MAKGQFGFTFCHVDEVWPLQVGLAGPQVVDFLGRDEGITLSDVVSELGVLGI